MEKSKSSASLRWKLLRRSLLSPSSSLSGQPVTDIVSRRATTGFNLIKCRVLDDQLPENLPVSSSGKDICISYNLPIGNDRELKMVQRREDTLELNDFEVLTKYNIDTTGLVCRWDAGHQKMFLPTTVSTILTFSVPKECLSLGQDMD